MQGVHGNFLRVDLRNAKAQRVALPDEVYHRVIGGVGLGLWLLLREHPGSYDALSPEAPLVVAFAPLAGTALNTSAKAAVLCKSPLSGRLNDAMVSSRFALTGKGTGSDALMITGTCERWSTLFVDPDGITLRETPDLVGLSADAAGERIRAAWGQDWRVLAIGPGGENQVPFATLTHEGRHAGRGGAGAVMGAKRLKALAVRGNLETTVAHPEHLSEIRRRLKHHSLGPGTEKYRTTGTLGNLLVFNRMGILPTDNFRASSDPRAQRLSAETLFETKRMSRAACADCTIGCEKRVNGKNATPTRLEYENVYALGPLLGLWDMDAVLEASRLCDTWGLDTISTGGTLAFAIECVQRGLLDIPELQTLDGATLHQAIRLTARREGYGALLALGSRELAHRVKGGSEAFAPHVKGLELPGYHPAALQTLGLGLAVGSRGADHNKSGAYDLDLSGEVDRFHLDTERIEAMIALEDQAALLDALILCKFVRRALEDVFMEGAAMLSAVTGQPFDAEELRAAARTIHDLRKLFNERQGWTAEEDILPERFLGGNGTPDKGPPPEAGSNAPPLKIQRSQFLSARARYYALRGWTTEGRLSTEEPLLRSLGLVP